MNKKYPITKPQNPNSPSYDDLAQLCDNPIEYDPTQVIEELNKNFQDLITGEIASAHLDTLQTVFVGFPSNSILKEGVNHKSRNEIAIKSANNISPQLDEFLSVFLNQSLENAVKLSVNNYRADFANKSFEEEEENGKVEEDNEEEDDDAELIIDQEISLNNNLNNDKGGKSNILNSIKSLFAKPKGSPSNDKPAFKWPKANIKQSSSAGVKSCVIFPKLERNTEKSEENITEDEEKSKKKNFFNSFPFFKAKNGENESEKKDDIINRTQSSPKINLKSIFSKDNKDEKTQKSVRFSNLDQIQESEQKDKENELKDKENEQKNNENEQKNNENELKNNENELKNNENKLKNNENELKNNENEQKSKQNKINNKETDENSGDDSQLVQVKPKFKIDSNQSDLVFPNSNENANLVVAVDNIEDFDSESTSVSNKNYGFELIEEEEEDEIINKLIGPPTPENSINQLPKSDLSFTSDKNASENVFEEDELSLDSESFPRVEAKYPSNDDKPIQAKPNSNNESKNDDLFESPSDKNSENKNDDNSFDFETKTNSEIEIEINNKNDVQIELSFDSDTDSNSNDKPQNNENKEYSDKIEHPNTANQEKVFSESEKEDNSNKLEDNSNKSEDNSNKSEGNSNKSEDNSNKSEDNSNKSEDNSNKSEDNSNKSFSQEEEETEPEIIDQTANLINPNSKETENTNISFQSTDSQNKDQLLSASDTDSGHQSILSTSPEIKNNENPNLNKSSQARSNIVPISFSSSSSSYEFEEKLQAKSQPTKGQSDLPKTTKIISNIEKKSDKKLFNNQEKDEVVDVMSEINFNFDDSVKSSLDFISNELADSHSYINFSQSQNQNKSFSPIKQEISPQNQEPFSKTYNVQVKATKPTKTKRVVRKSKKPSNNVTFRRNPNVIQENTSFEVYDDLKSDRQRIKNRKADYGFYEEEDLDESYKRRQLVNSSLPKGKTSNSSSPNTHSPKYSPVHTHPHTPVPTKPRLILTPNQISSDDDDIENEKPISVIKKSKSTKRKKRSASAKSKTAPLKSKIQRDSLDSSATLPSSPPLLSKDANSMKKNNEINDDKKVPAIRKVVKRKKRSASEQRTTVKFPIKNDEEEIERRRKTGNREKYFSSTIPNKLVNKDDDSSLFSRAKFKSDKSRTLNNRGKWQFSADERIIKNNKLAKSGVKTILLIELDKDAPIDDLIDQISSTSGILGHSLARGSANNNKNSVKVNDDDDDSYSNQSIKPSLVKKKKRVVKKKSVSPTQNENNLAKSQKVSTLKNKKRQNSVKPSNFSRTTKPVSKKVITKEKPVNVVKKPAEKDSQDNSAPSKKVVVNKKNRRSESVKSDSTYRKKNGRFSDFDFKKLFEDAEKKLNMQNNDDDED